MARFGLPVITPMTSFSFTASDLAPRFREHDWKRCHGDETIGRLSSRRQKAFLPTSLLTCVSMLGSRLGTPPPPASHEGVRRASVGRSPSSGFFGHCRGGLSWCMERPARWAFREQVGRLLSGRRKICCMPLTPSSAISRALCCVPCPCVRVGEKAKWERRKGARSGPRCIR